MRYMLLVYKDEKVWDEMSVQERGRIFQEAVEFSEALRPSGFYQGGKAVITDGPFAETKEHLGKRLREILS
jgi:hypothetical protein